MSKLIAHFALAFPDCMDRGQQKVADYLVNNGWVKQPKEQDNTAVWKCPVTGSNFLEPEALRRCEQTSFEDRAVIITKRLVARNDRLSEGQGGLQREVEELTGKNTELTGKVADLTAKLAAVPKPAAPTPTHAGAAAAPATGGAEQK